MTARVPAWQLCLTFGLLLVGAMADGDVGGREPRPRLEPLGERGAYSGFAVSIGGSEVARVRLGRGERWTARTCRQTANQRASSLELTGIATEGTNGTPVLDRRSYVRVRVAEDDPCPRVEFRLDIEAFDVGAWEAA